MESVEVQERPENDAPHKRRWGRIVLIVVAVIALLAMTATAVTAATGGRWFGPHGGNAGQGPGGPQGQGGPQGMNRGFPGLQGVVTAVDGNAKTITLAGVPSVTTVTVDTNVKLTKTGSDGKPTDASLSEFKAGQVVRVHGKIDRGQTTPGQRPNPANFKFTVTEIVLPSGTVSGFGLVTVSGNTLTVVGMGGLSVSVTPASGATIKKMDGTAIATGDIKVGDRVFYRGTQGSGNTVSATDIRVMTGGMFPGGPRHGGDGQGPGSNGAGFGPGGPGAWWQNRSPNPPQAAPPSV